MYFDRKYEAHHIRKRLPEVCDDSRWRDFFFFNLPQVLFVIISRCYHEHEGDLRRQTNTVERREEWGVTRGEASDVIRRQTPAGSLTAGDNIG